MIHRRRQRVVRFGVPLAMGLALVACGAEPAADSVSSPQVGSPGAAPVLEATESAQAAGGAPVEQADEAEGLAQPAIWPAADVVFATPEEAAADFVSSVLISEGDPVLGDFQQGDARSGEIAVLFAGETGDLDPPQDQGTLLLRQLGPTDGWYVIGAASDGVVIDSPSALDEVPAGVVEVSGEGRGFEGTLAVSAFPPGDSDGDLDTAIGAGGALADLEPFSVELDLTGATAGDVVVILVQGDTGLGSDPSTFAAIPVVVADATGGTEDDATSDDDTATDTTVAPETTVTIPSTE